MKSSFTSASEDDIGYPWGLPERAGRHPHARVHIHHFFSHFFGGGDALVQPGDVDGRDGRVVAWAARVELKHECRAGEGRLGGGWPGAGSVAGVRGGWRGAGGDGGAWFDGAAGAVAVGWGGPPFRCGWGSGAAPATRLGEELNVLRRQGAEQGDPREDGDGPLEPEETKGHIYLCKKGSGEKHHQKLSGFHRAVL